MNYHLVTGIFRILSLGCGCGETKGSNYEFVTADGVLNLAFEDDKQALATPINVPISLSISKEPLSGGCYLVNPDKKWYFKLPVSAYQVQDEYINGKLKKHVAVITAVSSTEEENPELFAKSKTKAEAWARMIENFYKTYADHAWDVRCEPFTIVSDCGPGTPEYCSYEYTKWAKENPRKVPDGFKPNYFHWIGGVAQFCGQAVLGGHAGATYTGGYHACGIHTAIHEIGHNFGMMHANRDNIEYKDDSSVMGGPGSSVSLAAPNLIYLGLNNPERTVFLDKTQQIQLAAIEVDELALNDDEKQFIVFNGPTQSHYGRQKYILSARKDKGHAYSHGTGTPFGEGGEPTLHLHEQYASESNFINYLRGTNNKWPFDKFTLEMVDYENEKYLLNVTFHGDASPSGVMKKGFPEVVSGVEVTEKHTGLWFDPKHVGQGFNLHVKNGRFTICWYTFDYHSPPYANSPMRRFYIGTGNLNSNGPEEFDIITTDKPYYGDDANKLIEKVIGRGRLYFVDDRNGVFDYITDELGRGSVALSPLLISENENNGLWHDPSQRLSGFSINFYGKNDENCVAYWYDYGRRWGGTDGPSGFQKYTDFNSVQRWYQCLGKRTANNEYKFKIQQIDNGIFRHINPIEAQDIGEATMIFQPNGTVNFTFDIESKWKYYRDGSLKTDVKKSGSMTLKRLF